MTQGRKKAPMYLGTQKECLKCGQLFVSYGSANRICEKCNADNQEVATRVEKGAARHRGYGIDRGIG